MAVGGSVKRWMQVEGRGVVFQWDKASYVDTPFIRRTEEEVYARRLACIVGGDWNLADVVAAAHSLDYDSFTRPYDNLHFPTHFVYLLK